MKGTGRWIGALAAAACLIVGTTATPVMGATTPETDRNALGFAQLQACLSVADQVEALYVMDVSGSLNDTDPGGQRFKALESSVSQLGALLDATNRDLRVEAALATFGDEYSGPAQVMPWTDIPPSGADQVAADFRATAESEWATARTAGNGTDYGAALRGAADSLRERGSDRGACRVMFWFTDGLFDLGDPAATNTASDALCAPNGPIDTIRQDQISVIALALFNQAVEQQLKEPQNRNRRGELQAMAVGASDQRQCGTNPLPEGARSGAFLPAESAVDLGVLFSGALAQGRGGTAVETASAQPATVVVEPGVREFQVDFAVSGAPTSVVVTSPDGTQTPVAVGGAGVDLPGGTARAHAYQSLATVTVAMPGSGTPGTWRVSAGRASSAGVYLFSGLTLVQDPNATAELVAGQQATVPFRAVDLFGQPADLSVYAQTEVAATTLAPDGTRIPTNAETDTATTGVVNVSLDIPPDATSLETSVRLVPTLASGLALAPTTLPVTLPVILPAAFPSVTPADELSLGTMVGTATLEGELMLTGSDEGPTEVCFDAPVDIQVPERAQAATLTTPECVKLAAGESAPVTVAVSSPESADGKASAVLPVRLISTSTATTSSTAASLPIAVTWDMSRPVDQGRRALLVAGLVLLAIALPLIALWASNRALARFKKGNARYSRQSIKIGPTGPMRAGTGQLFDPTDLEWDYLGPDQTRNYRAPGAGLVELRAIAPVNPFGGPDFRAIPTLGHRVVSADDGAVVHAGLRAKVTPGLGATYLLIASDAQLAGAEVDSSVDATLLLITRSDDVQDLQDLVRRAEHRFDWPVLLQRLIDAANEDPKREDRNPQPIPTEAAPNGESPFERDPLDPFADEYSTRTTPLSDTRSAPRRRPDRSPGARSTRSDSVDPDPLDPFA